MYNPTVPENSENWNGVAKLDQYTDSTSSNEPDTCSNITSTRPAEATT
ncbi:MAG: hypothetical protein DSM106950_41925 [Stigonema ocellatum SAG 48.90 = DSM 106950]|nr:hypothetical protein [Stigonema ocellatum SAG 48.90 = DSM 106950]